MAIEYPIEFVQQEDLFSIAPLDANMEARIEAGSTLVLTVNLLKAAVSGVSEGIKVLVFDKLSLGGKSHHVAIKIVEETPVPIKPAFKKVEADNVAAPSLFENMNTSPTNDLVVEDSFEKKVSTSYRDLHVDSIGSFAPDIIGHSNSAKSLIELKGCKKVYGPVVGDFEGFFEFDLGQQDLSTNNLVKRLQLESAGVSGVPFRVYTVSESDAVWLSLNRADGVADSVRTSTVQPSSSGGNSLSLTFNLSIRGSWCTYLVIENMENRMDTKFIRVSLEVVAKQNLKRTLTTVSNNSTVELPKSLTDSNRVFDVSTHALDWLEGEFNMGSITFGTFYVARSLVIWNREIVPLEFSISSNLPKEEDSELIFSLSRTGAKLFNSVRIEPESHCQVFLRFLFNPLVARSEELFREDYYESKNVEISVNCRLVKDYQKVINFKAQCHVPQLVCSETDFLFGGVFKEEKAVVKKSSNDVLVISNPSNSNLDIQIVCDSLYFGIEVAADDALTVERPIVWVASSCSDRSFAIKPNSVQKFRIVPILENIEKHMDQLKKVCLEFASLFY